MMDKGTIVFTFDDVIALTSYHLYEYLLADIKSYDHILDLFTLRTKKDIYERKDPNLITELLNKKILNNYDDKKFILVMVNNLFLSLFDTYYSNNACIDLELTSIANKILVNPLFTEIDGIKKIIIMFKYRTDKEKKLKYEFIKNRFKNNKLEVIPVRLNEKYIDIFNTRLQNWDLFVTDDIATVELLAKNDIDHKEFLLPRYGYNIAKPELLELIKQKSGTISYYEIEK